MSELLKTFTIFCNNTVIGDELQIWLELLLLDAYAAKKKYRKVAHDFTSKFNDIVFVVEALGSNNLKGRMWAKYLYQSTLWCKYS